MTGTPGFTGRTLAVRCPAWDAAGTSAGWASDPERGPRARAFEPVVRAMQEFCPQVEVLRPGLAASEARGPARYFGGEAVLADKVAKAVARLGFACGIGVADGLFTALVAAQDSLAGGQGGRPGFPGAGPGPLGAGPGPLGTCSVIVPPGQAPAFLAPRPVAILGEPELAELLARLGVGTVGDLAALPAAEVEARFGLAGLRAHRLARGLDPRPLTPRPPAADLSVQAEFDPPAEQAEQVIFAAKSLASRMHARLAANGLACVRVRVEVILADGREVTRLWRHDGLLTDLAVADRVRWQLDGWLSGSRATGGPGGGPGGDGEAALGGVTLLRLVPGQLARERGRQLGLWGDEVVNGRVARAALRLQAMLGHGAVLRPVLIGGRGPADRVMLVPFGDEPEPAPPADRPWPGQIPPPAPATVYPEPRPARVTGRSGVLVTVTGRGQVSAEPAMLSVEGGPSRAITAWTGPWPVTERWWDPARACRKARFQLVTVDGDAWLAVVQDGRWLIEARYD